MKSRSPLKLRAVMSFTIIGLCQFSVSQAESTFNGEDMRPTMILDVQPEYGGGFWVEQPGGADQNNESECGCTAEPNAEDATNDASSEDSGDSGDSSGSGDGGGDGGGY